MVLPPREAADFLTLYPSLIAFAAIRLGGVAGIGDLESFYAARKDAKLAARDALLDHPDLMDAFVANMPQGFTSDQRALVRGWKAFRRGDFVVERSLKEYTVFLDDANPARAYGVLGLTDPISELLPLEPPVMVSAVLLPFNGRIVCDGLINATTVAIGRNMRQGFAEQYRQAKARGIITSFDRAPTLRLLAPPKPKPPSIEGFLRRRCPKTLDEFHARYGEPRLDFGGDAAREYCLWRVDGSPAIETDRLLIYDNILRRQILYVYALAGTITHVAVVDPTD